MPGSWIVANPAGYPAPRVQRCANRLLRQRVECGEAPDCDQQGQPDTARGAASGHGCSEVAYGRRTGGSGRSIYQRPHRGGAHDLCQPHRSGTCADQGQGAKVRDAALRNPPS